MPEVPVAVIAFEGKARTRFRVPSRKNDAEYFAAVTSALVTFPGVHSAKGNHATGSILVEHDGRSREIAVLAREKGFFHVETASTPIADLSGMIRKGFTGVGRNLTGISGSKANWSQIAVTALIGVSVYQVMRGNLRAPAWYTALWYAYNIGRSDVDGKS